MIDLTGYQVIEPNQIYLRDNTTLTHGKEIPIKEIILLDRCNGPSRKEVKDYIKHKIELVLVAKGRLSSDADPLEEILINIAETEDGEEFLEDLKDDHPAYHGLLDKITPDAKISFQGSTSDFLLVRSGIVPVEVFDAEKKDQGWYEDKLHNNTVHEICTISLMYHDSLPAKKLINFFIEKGVDSSEIFVVNQVCYDKEEVQKIVDTIYSNPFTSEEFLGLQDISQTQKEGTAYQILLGLQEMFYQDFASEPVIEFTFEPDEDPKILN